MSYDPRYGAHNDYSTYPPQHQYNDQAQEYNPYSNSQPHRTYDQGGYGNQDTGYGGYTDEPAVPPPPPKEKETDTYVASRPAQPRSRNAMKRWRYEHQGNLWGGGSRARCCGRFFCCTILTTLFLLVSIVLSLLLWIKPPSIEIGAVAPVATGSPFQLQDNGLTINLEVPVAVANPNYFSVKFDSIDAKIFYPVNNTQLGGGNLKGLTIENDKQTNFTLPFSLNYTTTIDPDFNIILDIADRCGFTGKAARSLNVNYEIELAFKIGLIPIKPTIKNSANFACPIKESDIEGLLKSAGINLPDLSALLESLE